MSLIHFDEYHYTLVQDDRRPAVSQGSSGSWMTFTTMYPGAMANTLNLAITPDIVALVERHLKKEIAVVGDTFCRASVVERSFANGDIPKGQYDSCSQCPYQLTCTVNNPRVSHWVTVDRHGDTDKLLDLVNKETTPHGSQLQDVPARLRPGRPGVRTEKAKAHSLLGSSWQKGHRKR